MITLIPGERIYLVKRRHKFALYSRLSPVLAIFLLLLLSIFYILLYFEFFWPKFLLNFLPQLSSFKLKFFILFFLSQVLAFFWALIWLVFINYYFDFWIITDQRVIHAELKTFFNMKISSVAFDKIQDITVSIKGFFPAIFHFGDITIQTAGEMGQFTFSQIPDPEIVKQVIFEAQTDYLKSKK